MDTEQRRRQHDDAVRSSCAPMTLDPHALLAIAESLAAASPEPDDAQLRRLDVRLPSLLASDPAAAAAATAVCAALGDRVRADVRDPLMRLEQADDPRMAVAAHVAGLLVGGVYVSEQHLIDMAAVTGAPSPGRARSCRAAAFLVVRDLARAVIENPMPGPAESGAH